MEEDGEEVEPEWYTPVIPMALVNGAKVRGLGCGATVQLCICVCQTFHLVVLAVEQNS